MTITAPEPPRVAIGSAIDPAHLRKARIFGVLFGLTFVTSIVGLTLYDRVLNDADYMFSRSGLVPRWIAVFGLVGGPLDDTRWIRA